MHSHTYIDLFCDLNAKALREFRESFSTHTGCFCPKKKRRSSSLNNARKFSRVLKHSLRAFREQKRKRKSVPRERERFSLCWRRPLAFGRRVLLIRKLFERETTEWERERKNFISVSSSKLRGVLDERTSDQRRRRRRSERRFEIIRSFGDFSRSGRARLSFCSTTREQQREQQQSKKKRETFERKARGFKRDQIASSNLFRRFFLLCFLGGGFVGRGEVFLLKIWEKDARKKRKKRKEREREREKEISPYTRRKTTPRQQSSGKSRSIRLSYYIRLSYTSFINKGTEQNGTVFRATRKRGDDAVWREYDEYYYEE